MPDSTKTSAPDNFIEEPAFSPPAEIAAAFSPQSYFGGDRFECDVNTYQKYANRKTGFDNIDEVQPLYSGLYVLGAISSLGKTTFIHQMADNLAEAGEHVLYFSLEQSCFELFSKSLARRLYQNRKKNSKRQPPSSIQIRNGEASKTPELKAQIEAYTEAVQDRLYIFECNFDVTVETISEVVKSYMDQTGHKPVVIIDYLQIIAPSTNDKQRLNTRDNIDDIIHKLKVMQSENGLLVIVISSFNRQNYMTTVDHDSFKESGGIEYTADVLWGLQLSILHDKAFLKENNKSIKQKMVDDAKEASPREIELVCLKNRYGKCKYTVKFKYFPESDCFEPVWD